MDNIGFYTALGTSVIGSLFLLNHYKHIILNKAFDIYVDLTYDPKKHLQEIHLHEQNCPQVIATREDSDGMKIYFYQYNGKNYVSLYDPPTVHHVSDTPEELEFINIEFFSKDEKDYVEEIEDVEYIKKVMVSYAGYLCDFHGKVPSLQVLKNHIPKLRNVKKITMNTTYWQEYICS